jgi:hypothetical protein
VARKSARGIAGGLVLRNHTLFPSVVSDVGDVKELESGSGIDSVRCVDAKGYKI